MPTLLVLMVMVMVIGYATVGYGFLKGSTTGDASTTA